MNQIDSIIKRLGYDKSQNLFYLNKIDSCKSLSRHDKRVLKILSPYAVYVANGKILALFFHDLHMRKDKYVHGKIWNAQMPVVISDEGCIIKIYNGKSMDLDDNRDIKLKHIISCNIEECNEDNIFSYWNITNNLSLRLYETSLDKKNLNEFLIDNLRYITKKLKYEYNITFANKLMLRILFIRYLIDRGINIGYLGLDDNIKKSQEIFLDIVKNKETFFDLIKYLKIKFNGNLFEINYEQEKEEITEEVLSMLYDFLTAKEEMSSGQLCLFPLYDFNIIPIEVISNIYEILLGKDKQNKDKAFYTPEYLAEYIINRTVSNYLIKKNSCKILDPACGSGIFLVKSLQKILENNVDSNGYIQDKTKIYNLVKNNIFGVDYNEEAVDVTIFSIYVTLFDYQDPKKLKDFKLPLLKNDNIIFGDFFDDNIISCIKNIHFDFILGNPPWGEVKQEKYKQYCKSKNIIPQDGEICVAFLVKVQEIGDKSTECSLVIPSKILYKGKKPSLRLREKLLADTQIQQILELSSVRKNIFKGAIAPATIISFICKENSLEHKIEYISLKPNKLLKFYGIIMIEPDDVKYVNQKLLLENDILWKILVYGGYWDFELILNIIKEHKTLKEVASEHNLMMTKGLQDNLGDKKDSSHLLGMKILDSNSAINHFFFDKKAYTIFNKENIHRPKKIEQFKGPYVLFKKGLDTKNYSIRAAYVDEDFLYRETINCIKGNKEGNHVLLNLCGLLNSSLFAYFNLMLGSSTGIEREQIFLSELENYPYSYSDVLVGLVQKIQQTQVDIDFEEIRLKIDELVMNMFNLSKEDKYFVDYATSIQIPIISGKYKEKKCDEYTLKNYIDIFLDIWNKHFEESGIYLSINIYPNIKNKFAAIKVKLSLNIEDTEFNTFYGDNEDINLLTKFIIYRINDSFCQTKDIIEFSEDSFVIVKPIELKNWHSAKAIKDSHKIINTVLLGKGN